jgi:glycosyltransferase involved in cell wall biosynthesis
MMAEPLISIITPSFNSEKYIEQCILSIKNQKYKYVEHIIQDGGSTDNTLKILEKYAGIVKSESGPDRGPADALNKAFARSKGDILLVLNSDDILLPFACSWAAKKFKKNPDYSVIYGNQYIIDENGEFIKKRYGDKYDFEKQFCVENVIPAQTAFVQRKFFEKIGLQVDPLTDLPDFDMWVNLGLCSEMKYYSKFLCKFRRHEDQISLSIDKILQARIQIMNKVFQNPEVPESIKRLKDRAYAGNYHWAAVESYGINKRKDGVRYLLKAYQILPEYRLKSPLFSVITPVKNSEKYLDACIKSVLAQDYRFVEHIVQDGGSSDGTLDILQRYGNEVDWKSEPDKGESDGLDKALKRINGEIIIVLNSDDLLLKNSCSLIKYFFTRYTEVAVIYGNQFNISAEGRIISASLGPSPYNFERMFCVESVIPAQAAFINRRLFEESGLSADKTLKTCPDYEIWVRLGLRYKMKYINYFLGKYRQHPNSSGRIASNITGMIEAKIQVIDKSLNDISAFPQIRGLKCRAYGGVYFWAAVSALSLNKYRTSLDFLKISRHYYPLTNKIIIIVIRKLKKQLSIIRHLVFTILLKSTFKFRSKFGLTKQHMEYLTKFLLE